MEGVLFELLLFGFLVFDSFECPFLLLGTMQLKGPVVNRVQFLQTASEDLGHIPHQLSFLLLLLPHFSADMHFLHFLPFVVAGQESTEVLNPHHNIILQPGPAQSFKPLLVLVDETLLIFNLGLVLCVENFIHEFLGGLLELLNECGVLVLDFVAALGIAHVVGFGVEVLLGVGVVAPHA